MKTSNNHFKTYRSFFLLMLVYCQFASAETIKSYNQLTAKNICIDDGHIKIEESFDDLVFLSKSNDAKLSRSYEPSKLVPVDTIYKYNPDKIEKLTPETLQAFKKMAHDALNANVDFKIYSSHRSFDHQCNTFLSKYRKYKNQFKNFSDLHSFVTTSSATPGNSEHQLGTTFDLVFPRVNDELKNFSKKEQPYELDWLLNKAHLYGFVLSYPPWKPYETKLNQKIKNPLKNDYNQPSDEHYNEYHYVSEYAYESWHWRYIGVQNAQDMMSLSRQVLRRISVKEFILFKQGKIDIHQLKEPLTQIFGEDNH